MIIRKLYKFEASHIVRNCSSDRCKYSVHGHSFRVELFLTADRLDDGQMVYDFGLLKGTVKDLLDGFDHAALFWDKEAAEYQKLMKSQSKRWVQLPVSPTAERAEVQVQEIRRGEIEGDRRSRRRGGRELGFRGRQRQR